MGQKSTVIDSLSVIDDNGDMFGHRNWAKSLKPSVDAKHFTDEANWK